MKPSFAVLADINVVQVKRIRPRARYRIGRASSYSHAAKAQILILVLSLPAAATSIVVVRTPTQVTIGADSRGSFDDGKTVEFKPVCKIHTHRGIAYAISGIESDPITGFNALSIIVDEINKTASLSALVSAIEPILKARFDRELEWQKKERPDLYRRTTENKIALGIVIAGVENSMPAFYVRAFMSDGTTMRRDYPANTFTVWLGKADAIERFVAQNHGFNFNSPADGVRTLVQLEIDDGEVSVGAPIDILLITKDGLCWVQHKKDCDSGVPECPAPAPTPLPAPQITPSESRSPLMGAVAVAVLVVLALGYIAKRRFSA